jgi:hypothetical protein
MLKPGGVLIIETLTTETLRVRPDYTPDYLLQPLNCTAPLPTGMCSSTVKVGSK